MKRLRTYTITVLGCKVNQYDARQIARVLEGFGLREAGGAAADLVVVHTCGVTATAVQKSRQTVRRAIRTHPGPFVFLTGCAAAEEVIESMDGVNVRIAAGPGWVQLLADQLQTFSLPNPDFRLPENADTLGVEAFGEQTRAYLKVQDGCDAGCAYCIVPKLRGVPRDKPLADIVREAEALITRGYREIVVTGVHVGLYGRENDISLCDILAGLVELKGDFRIRMSSLHPTELTAELLAVWALSPKVMPHLHLSLQSGSDGVLSRMGRGYTADEYAMAVERARTALNHPAITTDVIVGFPGETDKEFEETFEFCEQIGFSRMHIFTFSPRPGTRAADLPDAVPPKVAQERHRRLSVLADEMAAAFHETFIGQTARVLVERCKNGTCIGGSEHYVSVRFPGAENLIGTIVSVKISAASVEGLYG